MVFLIHIWIWKLIRNKEIVIKVYSLKILGKKRKKKYHFKAKVICIKHFFNDRFIRSIKRSRLLEVCCKVICSLMSHQFLFPCFMLVIFISFILLGCSLLSKRLKDSAIQNAKQLRKLVKRWYFEVICVTWILLVAAAVYFH